jgi:hypothetical protein
MTEGSLAEDLNSTTPRKCHIDYSIETAIFRIVDCGVQSLDTQVGVRSTNSGKCKFYRAWLSIAESCVIAGSKLYCFLALSLKPYSTKYNNTTLDADIVYRFNPLMLERSKKKEKMFLLLQVHFTYRARTHLLLLQNRSCKRSSSCRNLLYHLCVSE